MDPSSSPASLTQHRFELSGRQVLSGFLATFMLMVTWCYNLFFVPVALAWTILEYTNNQVSLAPAIIVDGGLLIVAIIGTIMVFWLSNGVLSLKITPIIMSLLFGISYILFSIQYENLTVSGILFVICAIWAILLLAKERLISRQTHQVR